MRAVLTFHNVDESGSVLSIRPGELRSLVRAIRNGGHRIVPLVELLEAPAEDGRVALSFDDGLPGVHAHALPVLGDEAAPATLFLTTGYVGRDNRWSTGPANMPTFPMLGWSEVEALHAAGWAIEDHTLTHPHLTALSDAELEEELTVGSDQIEDRLGRRPEIFAYPFGSLDGRSVAAARTHFRFAVTARMATLGPRLADPLLVPRLDTFYFREPLFHLGFGRPHFRCYIAARALIRRIRHG